MDKKIEKTRNKEISSIDGDDEVSYNPQKNKFKHKNNVTKSYPQGEASIYDDGIRPNKIMTYMVHHLGMSFMAIENMLLNKWLFFFMKLLNEPILIVILIVSYLDRAFVTFPSILK